MSCAVALYVTKLKEALTGWGQHATHNFLILMIFIISDEGICTWHIPQATTTEQHETGGSLKKTPVD